MPPGLRGASVPGPHGEPPENGPPENAPTPAPRLHAGPAGRGRPVCVQCRVAHRPSQGRVSFCAARSFIRAAILPRGGILAPPGPTQHRRGRTHFSACSNTFGGDGFVRKKAA